MQLGLLRRKLGLHLQREPLKLLLQLVAGLLVLPGLLLLQLGIGQTLRELLLQGLFMEAELVELGTKFVELDRVPSQQSGGVLR